MDYSNYTLLTVGCSFTFGQGAVPHFDKSKSTPENNEARDRWRKECNLLSYGQRVKEIVKFKKVVNLGTPAGSNELALLNMNTWLDKNKGENVFVLFSLADPQREMFFTKNKISRQPDAYGLEVFNVNHTQGLHPNVIEGFYTYINTDLNMTFKNWIFRKQLSSILSYRNLPNLVFHAYDPMDIRITKLRKIFKLTEGTMHWHDLDIISDFIQWMETIEDEPTFENYISINKIKEWALSEDWSKDLKNIVKIEDYLQAYCKRNKRHLFAHKTQYGNRGEAYSPFDNAHYNKQAHVILGDKLSQEIHKIS